ncbi:MAG TPA: phospho-sugar mutase [Pseudogracilibacillus sp.]|nr:phospho-sugar mutase [Pseudogracilibacillus sp.]
MQWQDAYKRWKNFSGLDETLQTQLENIEDETDLEDRFYKHLEFGTGGMRGIIGPGTNRMNIYTVRKAAEGLARYIEEQGEAAKQRGVVIAYDSRHQSKTFALESAKTIGQHGIQTYVFESLRTTPELSFAVRYLHACSGIVITASHNPAPYNGFKVYGEDGAQFASEDAEVIVDKVNSVENELEISVAGQQALLDEGLLTMIGEKVDKAYLEKVASLSLQPEMIHDMANELRIVYTPLHGTGNRPVQEGLAKIGLKQVEVVKEQEQPDPDFSTVKQPNPEEDAAFELAIQYGEKNQADILLATDPDTDRVGVAVRNKTGTYELLNGNQIGALLVHYLINEKEKRNELADNAVVLKTIVTSELGSEIARAHGLTSIDTLTGFKYISEKIKEFETTGAYEFLIGYEESYGYLIGDFVRDKDAVQTCLLIAEAAAHHKKNGMSLKDVLDRLYDTYGFYQEGLESLTLEGRAGVETIAAIMDDFRTNPPTRLAEKDVLVSEDYASSKRKFIWEDREETIELPTSNVLKYKLNDGAWFCIRPSGTEPKIKFYFGVKEATKEGSSHTLHNLKQAVMAKVKA